MSIFGTARKTAFISISATITGGWLRTRARGAEKAQAEYDLIILDPPSFTKARSGLRDALRGYRELHVRAFKLVSKNGVLATFSCSHHVSQSEFEQTIADALV